jgi:GNAT superfamily N-acetyltransferase
MGWSTTSDLDRFLTAAEGYLTSHAAENTPLLSAAQAVRFSRQQPGRTGLLFGWWEPWDGADPRGAFLHDPGAPLLIAGRAPEMAAALAATLAKMGSQVSGVDAPVGVADAFAAAWSQRAGATIRVHRQSSVYRLAVAGQPRWPPPNPGGPVGRLRLATTADRGLLADWVRAFGMETGERIAAPDDLAGELISYGGAFFWEVAHKPKRLLDAAHYLAIPHHRETAAFGEQVPQPVAFVALAPPVVGTVRLSMVYTLPERRHHGYAAALMLAVSHAALAGDAPGNLVPGAGSGPAREVVLVTDRNGPDRRITRLGYQFVAERAVLRFGPPTAPLPKLRATRPMPRLPTGPLPRIRH